MTQTKQSNESRRLMYEGRVVPHPDEGLVDQGLQFDLGTVFSRHRLLSLVGLGAGALTLAACGSSGSSGSSGTTTVASGSTTGTSATTTPGTTSPAASGGSLLEIPDETNGPYPADGTNGVEILDQSGVVRSDITSSFGQASGVADGVPLTFSFRLIDMANGNIPFEGAAVYAWHCDAEGRYSLYTSGAENENYLRGVQVADNNGEVTFTSIFPACYTGRWPHIHFEVYPTVDSITDHDNSISTSQAAIPEDACNDVFNNVAAYSASIQTFANLSLDDGIFTTDTIDQQMLTMTGNRNDGYTGSLTVPINATTAQTSSMGGGAGAPGAQGPGGGAPPSGSPPGGQRPTQDSATSTTN